MKKISYFIMSFLLIFCVFVFAGCSNKTVTKYYLNQDGELIVEFDNNTTENLGEWNSTIVNSLGSVGISTNGYYIINGVTTEIAVVYESVTISDDGFYVINGIKTTIESNRHYLVTFNTGTTTQIQSQRIEEGYRVNRPEIQREGYSLDGWYCNDELWVFNSDTVMVNITLTAKWTANHYQVQFENEKGVNPQGIEVVYDSEVSLPQPVDVQGFTFNGWYDGSKLVSDGVWKISNNVTLTANWTRDSYKVFFDTDGGNEIDPLDVYSYSQITELPQPERQDYYFLGWYLDNDLIETPYGFEEGNITLKAHWQGVTEKFEFTDDEAGTGIAIQNYKLDEETVEIPDLIAGKKVTTILTGAFKNKSNVKVIDFGNNVVNYEYKSIENCNALEEIRIIGDTETTLNYVFGNEGLIPSTLKTIIFKEKSKTFGDSIFDGLVTSRFKVYVNAEIRTAPKDAFYQCDVITELYFCDYITSFSTRTVCNVTNLTYIKLPNNLRSVGMNNFLNCHKLKYIIYPKSLTSCDYAGLCAEESVILVENTVRPSGWDSSAFSIYEEQMAIFYGFEKIVETDDFLYALCKVGSTTQCVIIQRYNDQVEYPEFIENYPVTFTNGNYTSPKA